MNVLIVDDDIPTLEVLKDSVRWSDFGITQVYTSYNIAHAKKILLSNDISIVISDIEMPQGTGLQLLEWFRKKNLKGEFLLFTCHENFSYAAAALKNHAAEYLLKPFDVSVMEVALKKIIHKIHEDSLNAVHIHYGKWAMNNMNQTQLDFFRRVFDGHIEKNFEEEISRIQLNFSTSDDFRIITSKITDTEYDKGRMNHSLFIFILENLHSEIFCGNSVNSRVICFEDNDSCFVATVTDVTEKKRLEEKCSLLFTLLKRFLSVTITLGISQQCTISSFYRKFRDMRLFLSENISYSGTSFYEDEIVKKETDDIRLDSKLLECYLENRKHIDILGYLKSILFEKAKSKSLSEYMLIKTKQELQRVTYSYASKHDIKSEKLLENDSLFALDKKAALSVMDMIKWLNFFLEKLFELEDESRKNQSIVEKIHQFIKDHYTENIGRNEIAEYVFFAPEYLSKMYKKKTGINLTDYINQYRMEQAKVLLEKEDVRVSDVAVKVGFENFAYFSSLFKKYIGLSPSEYRKEKLI